MEMGMEMVMGCLCGDYGKGGDGNGDGDGMLVWSSIDCQHK